MDLAARNKETAKIHSCNSSLSSLFRHKRRMELVEHHGPTRIHAPTGAYAIGGTAMLAHRCSIISAIAAARTLPPGLGATTCVSRRGTGRVLYYLTPAHSFLCDADLSEVSRRHVRKTSVFFLVTMLPKKDVTGLNRIIKRASSCRA